jgi:hypothetical protein
VVLRDVEAVTSRGELFVLGSATTTQWIRIKLGDQWSTFIDVEREAKSNVPGTVVSGSGLCLHRPDVAGADQPGRGVAGHP